MSDDPLRHGDDAEAGRLLAELAAAGCFSRALAVAARLGIADVLDGTFMAADDLALRTGTDPDVLLRLLQVLSLRGVFRQRQDGHFGLAAEFAALRSDHPRSLRHHCILMAETYDDAFGGLLGTVRTGNPGFEQVFGMPLYDYLAETPEADRIFEAAMAELAGPTATGLVERFDFSSVGCVVDVGGGNGTLLASILRENPHTRGICVDRPGVCERASARLAAVPGHPLADRFRFQPSDIFETVTEGGDVYLLKNVLHDWSPKLRLRILTTVRESMARTARARAADAPRPRLIVLEPLLDQESDAVHQLFQMVLCGKESHGFRTRDEMLGLLTEADFELLSVEQLPNGHHAFECV